MHNTPVLGQLIEGTAFRDAVHVAVAPVVAGEPNLSPGDHIGFGPDGRVYTCRTIVVQYIGIVDPFYGGDLQVPLEENDKFWMFLYPNTVTSLRHAWTPPAFQTPVPKGQ